MNGLIINDITEKQIKRKREKEKIKNLLRVAFGEKIKIKNRGDSSTLEIKFGQEVIMHLSFIGDSIRGYIKKYDLKYEAFGEAYKRITGRLTTLTKDYCGFHKK